MKKNIIDYKINEGIFIIHELLEILTNEYDHILPAEIKEEIMVLLKHMSNILLPINKYRNTDIKDYEYIRRIEYKK